MIEGEVEVRQGANHALLHPGDQITTDERLRTVAIEDEIAWSANADEHRQLLAELTMLHREVAQAVDIAAPRTSTRLLDLAPEDTVVYLAMPNLTEGLGAARQIFSSRLAESEVLREWWQREIVANQIDLQIEDGLDGSSSSATPWATRSSSRSPARRPTAPSLPLFLAELTDPQSFRALLEDHLSNHTEGAPPVVLLDDPDQPVAEGAEVVIWVSDDLVAAGPSVDQIRATAARIAGTQPGFSGSDLHQRLAESYAGGVEWLVGMDLQRTIGSAVAAGSPGEQEVMERIGLLDATTLVFERRRSDAGSAIDGEVRFDGPRRGVAAWLAEPAPLATLDYVSADAYLVTAVAAKDGAELFDELLGLVADAGPDALARAPRLRKRDRDRSARRPRGRHRR